jgi:hypothetical protein
MNAPLFSINFYATRATGTGSTEELIAQGQRGFYAVTCSIFVI